MHLSAVPAAPGRRSLSVDVVCLEVRDEQRLRAIASQRAAHDQVLAARLPLDQVRLEPELDAHAARRPVLLGVALSLPALLRRGGEAHALGEPGRMDHLGQALPLAVGEEALAVRDLRRPALVATRALSAV